MFLCIIGISYQEDTLLVSILTSQNEYGSPLMQRRPYVYLEKRVIMQFTLSGDVNQKIGRYTSVFSKTYQIARAIYDARIRNWNIEIIGSLFFVSGKDEVPHAVYFDRFISNCECDHFIQNECGTCMHIEAVKILVQKERISLREMRQRSITYIDHRFNIAKTGNGEFVTPAVRPFREHNEKRLPPPYEPPTDNYDVFTDYGINLRSFQLSSVDLMLRNKRTVLCLQMGLGKTIAALACNKIIGPERVLIVAPNSLKYQWQKEINRFELGTSLVVAKGSDLESYSDQTYLILSYEMLNRHHEILEDEFNVLIADEIQKIKNPDSVSWATIKKVKSEFVFALSGTPIQNSLSDLISIIDILNPRELQPKWRFYEEFCAFTRARLYGIRPYKVEDLKNRLERYLINPAIDPDEFPLPSTEEETICCPLTIEQSRIHNNSMQAARPLIAKSINYFLTFSERAILNGLLTKALMASVDSRLIDPRSRKSTRFERLEEKILEIIERDEKVVVYSQWIKCLNLIKSDLEKKDIGYTLFNGTMNARARNKSLNRFIEEPEIKVFLSTDSGGVGIDGLQLVACNVIHIESLWNPMKIEQRNGRVVRALQPRDPVNIIRFTANCDIEEMIGAASDRKRSVISSVLS